MRFLLRDKLDFHKKQKSDRSLMVMSFWEEVITPSSFIYSEHKLTYHEHHMVFQSF